ncbi:MAG TPA: hypothetical protein VFT95_17115, partial [Micromonosporaceae bacterium]|nr:hypothetical protein [Micromonosporaceae bacterium]
RPASTAMCAQTASVGRGLQLGLPAQRRDQPGRVEPPGRGQCRRCPASARGRSPSVTWSATLAEASSSEAVAASFAPGPVPTRAVRQAQPARVRQPRRMEPWRQPVPAGLDDPQHLGEVSRVCASLGV